MIINKKLFFLNNSLIYYDRKSIFIEIIIFIILFASSINGQSPTKTYNVKTYPLNSEGVRYGEQKNFTPLSFAEVIPIADFIAFPTNINTSQSLQFADQSPDNSTSWSWNFGDESIYIGKKD